MTETIKISVRQMMVLATLITVGDAILVLPAVAIQEAGKDAWISAVLGLAGGLLVILLFLAVHKCSPNMSLVEINKRILGKWLGDVVSLLFIAYVLLCLSFQLREVGDFAVSQIMPDTPIEAILILVFLLIIMGVRLGLETFTRVGEIFFPWFILLFLVLAVSLAPAIDLHKMQPVFDNGIKPVLSGTIACIAFPFMEIVVLMMIFPNVNRPEKLGRGMLWGAAIGGAMLAMTITLTLLVIGAEPAARDTYPSYDLAKRISIANFFQRIEAILALMWIITTYFKMSLYLYAFCRAITQIFKLKDYRMLTFPAGMVVVALSQIIAPNVSYFNAFLANYWPYMDTTFSVLLPVLLLVVYAARKRRLESGSSPS